MPLAKDRAITQKGARALFNSSFITRRRRLIYPKIVEVVDSHVERDFARNVGTVPQLEEVIDDINAPPIADFRDYQWDWTNRLYKSKINIQRSLLDFDQVGQTYSLIHSMGARLANLPDLILSTRLLATGSGVAAGALGSGEASGGTTIELFSASHLAPIGSTTTQNNIVTGTTPSAFCAAAAVQTVAQQLLNDFRVAKTTMRSFLDDRGQPWHDDDIRSDDLVILCSPLLEHAMEMAFFTNQINASDNVMRGKVREVISSNYLPSASTNAGAADWYLFNIGELKRPIVYSRFRRIRDEEIEDAFKGQLDKLSESGISLDDLRDLSSVRLETNLGHQGMNADVDVMENDRFMIAAQWRGELFGGEWRNAVRVNNAAA